MVFVFGDTVVDSSCFELRRKGRLVKLEPKVYDVLIDLIKHRDRVVTKQELLDRLWAGESVSDSVLPRCIAALRRAVGDTRSRQRVIATAHGRGYRFVASLVDSESSEGSRAEVEIKPNSTSPADPRTIVQSNRARGVRGAEAPLEDSDFVGRDEALGRLNTMLGSVLAGRGGICLVVGEPGIGKTRIADEFSRAANESGVEVLLGRCYEGEGAPAYWPWLQVLRDAFASVPDDDRLRAQLGLGASDLMELVPELALRFRDSSRSKGPEGEQARFRLFDAATRFLLSRTEDRPLLLILDDLHWADSSSLGLIRFLAGEVANSRILILATYRDVDVRRGHPLADLLGALARESHCERIPLTGFDESEVAALIAHLAGEAPSTNLVKTIRDMTEGNPFFLREMVRLLVEQGPISEFESDRIHALELPQGIRDAVGRRLDGLSPECNEMLRAASVIGRSFRVSMLSQMIGPGESESLESLWELIAEAHDAGVIVEESRGRYAFGHALTRQTLYDEIRAPQRIGLHRRAGGVLEGALDPAQLAHGSLIELAHHYFEAAPGGDVDKAIAYAVAAAEASHQMHAYDEAAELHQKALELVGLREPEDETRRAELTLALGEAQFVAGNRASALATLDQAVEMGRRLGRFDLMASAAIAIRGFGELGSPPAPGIVALLRESLEALPEDEYRLRAQLTSRLGGAAATTMEERGAIARRSLELAELSGDPVAERDAWSSFWWATLGPDRVDQRYEAVRGLRALADRTGDPRTYLLSLECEIGADLLRGDFASTERNLIAYEETAAELRQPIFIFMGMNYRTGWLIMRGQFSEAEALVEKAADYGKSVVPFASAVCTGHLFWSKSSRGLDTQTIATGEELAGLVSGSLMSEDVGKLFQAMVLVAVGGDVQKAYEMVCEADYRSIERDEHWTLAMSSLSDLAIGMEDREMLEWLYEALLPYTDLIAMHDLLRTGRGSIAATVGAVATALDRLDDAVRAFERAIELESAADMRHGLALSQLALSDVLRRRNRDGDAEKADELFAQAASASATMGLGPGSRLYRLRELWGGSETQ